MDNNPYLNVFVWYKGGHLYALNWFSSLATAEFKHSLCLHSCERFSVCNRHITPIASPYFHTSLINNQFTVQHTAQWFQEETVFHFTSHMFWSQGSEWPTACDVPTCDRKQYVFPVFQRYRKSMTFSCPRWHIMLIGMMVQTNTQDWSSKNAFQTKHSLEPAV